MSRRPFIAVLGMTTLFVAACSSAGTGPTTTAGKPLIYEPTTGVTFSDDFNPYDPNSVASSVGMKSIVYEPLVEFDQLDPTAAGTHYWLATALRLPEQRQGPADHRPNRREVQRRLIVRSEGRRRHVQGDEQPEGRHSGRRAAGVSTRRSPATR